MAAPVVENLQDVIAGLTAANDPILQNLAEQDKNIQASQDVGIKGIDAAKTQAFGDITTQAGNRGALFSGFTPDAQAKYTSATYLPALAKLQQAITESRTALAGQKAGLLSQINNQADTTVRGEKSALQQWQDAQDRMAAEQAFQEKTLQEQQAFEASQTDKKLSASASEAEKARNADATNLDKKQAFDSAQNALDRQSRMDLQKLQNSASYANASAGAKAAANKQATDLRTSYNGALTTGINDIISNGSNGQGTPWATEALIGQLQKLYPEYDPNKISSEVYQYRKPLEQHFKF